jgi:hypothetical protein
MMYKKSANPWRPAVLVDQHRSHADPDPDATFNFDADRDPDRTLRFTEVKSLTRELTLIALSLAFLVTQ